MTGEVESEVAAEEVAVDEGQDDVAQATRPRLRRRRRRVVTPTDEVQRDAASR
jgi:hypothetical protein